MRFVGKWESRWTRGASGQTYRRSKTRGAYASGLDRGDQCRARRSQGAGPWSRAYLRRRRQAPTVDLYAPSYRSSGSCGGATPLEIATTRSRSWYSAPSGRAATSAWVNVDAIDVVGDVNPMPLSGTLVNSGSAKLAKRGRWWVSEQDGAFGGRAWRTTAKGCHDHGALQGHRRRLDRAQGQLSGRAAVMLDGKRVGDGEPVPADRPRSVASSGRGAVLPYGAHNLTIRALEVAEHRQRRRVPTSTRS